MVLCLYPVSSHLGHLHSVRQLISLIMSLWQDRTRLAELLNGIPRVVLGGLETEDEGPDDRTVVIFVEEGVEAVEETGAAAVDDAGSNETLAMILGSVAALVVAGSILYVVLSRVLPMQTRRIEAAAWSAATTVVQVKFTEYYSLVFLDSFTFH